MCVFCFFKQKTAYELRISDWSSDVCSSDLSNDVTRVTAARAGYGAFLTAQGKFLFDFFLIADGDALVLDTEGARVDDFFRRLRMYKLRSRIELSQGGYRAAVALGDDALDVLGLPAERGAAAAFADRKSTRLNSSH